MPVFSLSDEMYAGVVGSKLIYEAVVEEEIELGVYIEFLIGHGINAMLGDVLRPVDEGALMQSFEQLGARYPEVYGYIAEVLKTGAEVEERERMRRRLGFRRPGDE